MKRLCDQIESFEREARVKYSSALCRLWDNKPANWFLRVLNKKILPPLSKIGFEDQLSRVLFQASIHSWQRMGPSVEDCLWLHPSLTRNIREIRRGVVIEAEKKRKTEMALASMSNLERSEHIRWGMAPENLTSMLDDIPISWIILPRAYSMLQENDGCCLLSYLNYLKRESNPDFKKLIAKIVTEFLANYSLKFASPMQHEKALSEVIFYGYATLFWKTLEHPPEECEELAIYKNFLGWAQAFQNRSEFITSDMVETIKKMVAMEQKLFANEYNYFTTTDKEIEKDRFLITLRHGTRGVEAMATYFGIAAKNLSPISQHRLLVSSGVKALTCLIREIEKEFANETKKTQEMILIFMKQLQHTYSTILPDHLHSSKDELHEQLRFAGPRLVNIIDDYIRQSLQ